MRRDYSKFEEKIDYTFSNIQLLEQAFSHSSYVNERKVNHVDSYERMEFLGDAVLELVVSQYLFDHYKEKTEGELTKLRASLVCEATLSQCAKEMGISDYLLLSKGEELTGGRQRESILCDVFEAVLGAIYLDGGLNVAKKHLQSNKKHRFCAYSPSNLALTTISSSSRPLTCAQPVSPGFISFAPYLSRSSIKSY